MIQFACLCGVRDVNEGPLPPDCWRCGDRMYPYAEMEPARPIGEILEPIVDDIMIRATYEKGRTC